MCASAVGFSRQVTLRTSLAREDVVVYFQYSMEADVSDEPTGLTVHERPDGSVYVRRHGIIIMDSDDLVMWKERAVEFTERSVAYREQLVAIRRLAERATLGNIGTTIKRILELAKDT